MSAPTHTDQPKSKARDLINRIAQTGTKDSVGEAEVYRQITMAMLNIASPAMLDAALKAVGSLLESENLPLSGEMDLDEACEDIRDIREEIQDASA